MEIKNFLKKLLTNDLENRLKQNAQREAIKLTQLSENTFYNFMQSDLKEIDTLGLVDMSNAFGQLDYLLEDMKAKMKDIPDYEQTLVRLNTMKKKLYKEAERRDGEE